MKQIQECLDRHFEGKFPLQKKWQAREREDRLYLYHYHHLILVVNLKSKHLEYAWFEKQADKRGLNSAIKYLANKFEEELVCQ